MKAKDLAKILMENPNFDVVFTTTHTNESQWGFEFVTYDINDIELGHSDKVIHLGGDVKI